MFTLEALCHLVTISSSSLLESHSHGTCCFAIYEEHCPCWYLSVLW